MKKLLCLILILINFNACSIADPADAFKWATIDAGKVRQRVLKYAWKENPFVGIDVNNGQVTTLRNHLSNEIKWAKLDLCTNNARSKIEYMNLPDREQKKFIHSNRIDSHECRLRVESDPIISQLEQRLAQLNSINNDELLHGKQVRALAEAYADKLITNYTTDKYDVVIQKGTQNIIYNKAGVSVDITYAVLAEIDREALVLDLDNDDE